MQQESLFDPNSVKILIEESKKVLKNAEEQRLRIRELELLVTEQSLKIEELEKNQKKEKMPRYIYNDIQPPDRSRMIVKKNH